MNWKRWLIVGYLLALMAFTTSVLLIPGEKYDTLTTSDSGWFYDVAAEIDQTNALAENNPLSHAPHGLPVSLSGQAQPLITVMFYRGVHALNPSVELMDVVRYWGPLLFALSLIPIFLIGKELGGDLGGCAAAFFGATLASSIYWMKVGAYDADPIQLILGAWTIYLTIKLFKAHRSSIPKFALLAGLVYGLFGLAWAGALYIAPIIIGFLILVLLSERLTWLPVILAGSFLLFTGFMGAIFKGGGTPGGIINLIYILVGALVFAAIIEIYLRKASVISLFKGILTSIRANIHLIVGVLGMLAVMTFALCAVGGQSPMLWTGFGRTLLEYAGIGGAEGISLGRYAGEMAAPGDWGGTIYNPYGGDPAKAWILPGNAAILTVIIFILVVLALVWFCWYRKREGVLALSWLIILALMVWPGSGQARFTRMWWPFVPALAGAGAVVLVSLIRRLSFEQFGDWLKHFQRPIVVALGISIVATPFVFNAYRVAGGTTPPTEWRSVAGRDEGFMDAFAWIRENTPENSIFTIQWSFGHVFTSTARRATVTDGAGPTMGKLVERENKMIYVDEAGNPLTIIPPDEVYWVEGNLAKYVGASDPQNRRSYRPYHIEGRRPDVWRLSVAGENEFRWIINTYRDNYNCKIDYVIFDIMEYYSAADWSKWTPANLLLGSTVKARLQSWGTEDQNIVFNLGENRENVIFNTQTGDVYLRTDDENLDLDGYALFTVTIDEEGRISISDFYGFTPPSSTPDLLETLLIFFNKEGFPRWDSIVTAWLVESKSAEINAFTTPMAVRIFTGDITGIDYLQIAYTSSNGLVKVVEIDHENLP